MYPSLTNLFNQDPNISQTTSTMPNTNPQASNNSSASVSESDPNEYPMPSLSLGELFKFIHPFDGTREDLHAFIQQMNTAVACATTQQYFPLLKYAITQLRGKASTLTSTRNFSNWKELRDFLILHYQDQKHHSQLLNELTNLQQKPNENITSFVERLELLLKRLTVSITQNTTDIDTLLAGRLNLMNEIAMSRFVHFTNSKISDRLRATKFQNLNEAISTALAEESALRMINPNSFRNSANSLAKPNFIKPLFPKTFHEKRYCSYCKTNTHNTDKCYNKGKNPIRAVQPTNNFTNNPKSCAYCKNIGHVISECRKKQFNDSRKIQNPTPAQNVRTVQNNEFLNEHNLPETANTEEIATLTLAM